MILRHGGPEVVEVCHVPVPDAGEGHVLVKVVGCGLNALDIFVRKGMPGLPTPLPMVTGGDIVGMTVTASDGIADGIPVLVDPGGDGFMIGETCWGGLAEYVVVPASNVIALPPLDAETMLVLAALPVAYGTARRMLLNRAEIEPGETVVVLGATGGVGVACVQLAHAVGCRVIACTGSAAKEAQLFNIGADEVVNASSEDFSAAVWRRTGKQGAHVVVDYLGQATWSGSIRCLRSGGRLVTCGASTGYEATTDLRYVWTRQLDIRGSDGWSRDDLTVLIDQTIDGSLQPVIDRVLPLSRVHEGLAAVENRSAFGKVIVRPGSGLSS